VSLLDVAREEQRRRREGRPPLPVPSRSSRGWLRRSGHDWKLRAVQWVSVAWLSVLLLCFVVGRAYPVGQQPPRLYTFFTAGMMLSLPLGVGVLALRASVKCRVCGLRLGSCAEARRLGWRRWLWVETLEACPGCGDDGTASALGRARWAQSGSPREAVYWSPRRVMIGAMLAAAVAVALLWYGSRLKAP